jgi:hypothetical protein
MRLYKKTKKITEQNTFDRYNILIIYYCGEIIYADQKD